MLKFKMEKLVRDLIPENLKQKDIKTYTKTLSDTDFKQALLEKMQEECIEIIKAKTQTELIEEIADLMEVVEKIMEINHITQESLQAAKDSKNKSKGSFNNAIYITHIEMDEENSAKSYYLSQAEKYPSMD